MEKKNILIVDDEPEITELIFRHVHDNGWSAETAANGIEALAVLKRCAFDVVICDITMPVLGGMAFMNAVRLSGNNIPFVFLTASGEISHMKEALRLGAFDYFEKPIGGEELIEVLSRAKELSESQQRVVLRLEANHEPVEDLRSAIARIRAKNNLKR